MNKLDKRGTEMLGRWLNVEAAEGGEFEAYVATPPKGSGPGLVLVHEIFGVTAEIRALADYFAQEGYVVAVPDIFWRTERRPELGPDDADKKRALQLGKSLDDSLAIDDILSTANALRSMSVCKGKIGALGYCMGGRLAVGAAASASGQIACAVSYYGVGIDRVLGADRDAAVPMVLHFGSEDSLISPAEVTALRDRWHGRDDVHVYSYPGAGHGFASPGRPSFKKAAADMAHSRTIGLLREVLGPYYDLSALWEAHRACEFEARDTQATMKTMVAEPYVNHIPTLTGGYGHDQLAHFYEHHFIPKNPADIKGIPISRTVGSDRVVNEVVLCFTHDVMMDWMLPGVAPTGKYVEVVIVSIINFLGDKLYHEHIYWDQASVLVQIGLLDPTGLPVSGVASARKVMDPSLAPNELMPNWNFDGGS